MLNRRHMLTLLAAPAILPFLPASRAMASPQFESGGVAIRGADPVAYFTEGGPRIGDAAHAADWNGVSWHFISAANRDTFLATPEAYAPQYGGHCALAMAHGALASSVPEAWTIHENRLFLNFSLDVREQWQRDIPGFVARADSNWPNFAG